MAARFIEGEGWLVEEAKSVQGIATVAEANARLARQNAGSGATSPTLVGSTTAGLAAELSARGMVVMSVDEHEALLVVKEEHEKLKAEHATLQSTLTSIDDLAGNGAAAAVKAGKPTKRSMEEMEKLITDATTLDQLTELMKDEERKTVLKLGEARAVEIQGGNA